MGEIDGVEIHHDVAEVDKTDVVHGTDKENLLIRMVRIWSLLSKDTFSLITYIRVIRLFTMLLKFHLTDPSILYYYIPDSFYLI